MSSINPIVVGNDALDQFVAYCQQQQLKRFTLIADANTYAALGARVEAALQPTGAEITRIVLEGDEIIADEVYLIQTLLQTPLGPCTFLAVGSGTLTDITRFISHRTGRSFISLPSAPSVDGFASIGAPLVLKGVKQTITEHAPLAIFADLDTLCQAPRRLVAAGYGDMIGKFTALADWKLSTLIRNEPFDDSIFKRTQVAVENCTNATEAIGQQTEEGMRILINALIESGQCILDLGNSRSASGAEHHASHFWEMKLLQEGRPAILHGAKVGFGLIQVAKQYVKLRALSRDEMLDRLEAATLPDRDADIANIRQVYGPLANDVVREHKAFLDMTAEDYDRIKRNIAENWDAIQEAAALVPPPEQIRGYLERVGGPVEAADLGFSDEEVKLGLEYGHYLRNRFTIMKLSRVLGLPLS